MTNRELIAEVRNAIVIKDRSLHYTGPACLVEYLVDAFEQANEQIARLSRAAEQAIDCDGTRHTTAAPNGWAKAQATLEGPRLPLNLCPKCIVGFYRELPQEDAAELCLDLAGDR
jgi:hypothetical protein